MIAQEIRIDNFYYMNVIQRNLNFKKVLYKIDHIAIRDAVHYGKKWTGRPVRINKKWLYDFAFHADNYGLFEKVKNNKPYKSGCTIELWVRRYRLSSGYVWDVAIGSELNNLTHIKFISYVHQLQNLYFELFGKELEQVHFTAQEAWKSY